MIKIHLNQIGYQPTDIKTAVFAGITAEQAFTVHNEKGIVVLTGTLNGPIYQESAREKEYFGDFSELTETGTYRIFCEDASSYPFCIGTDIYTDALYKTFRMFYLQRCGTALEPRFAGDFAHDSCHKTPAILYGTKKSKNVNGGWHDAGDYGRYVVAGAIAVADLFYCYLDFPELFSGEKGDSFRIPESGNHIPDILDEARYELEWMLKMQDEESGGVYHKVTGKSFPGFVMPEEETEPLYLSPISTTATADFSAIMAKSYTIYSSIDLDFAEHCLFASKKAWNYLLTVHTKTGFVNPADIKTGEYGDKNDSDERYWAAAELYTATGEEEFLTYMEQALKENIPLGFGWKNVGFYGHLALLRKNAFDTIGMTGAEPSRFTAIQNQAKHDFIQYADHLLENSIRDAFGISLGNHYEWGSNMDVCNNARILLTAYGINKNDTYRNSADNHFHYLFGKNPVSFCYLSGTGTNSPRHPHHRPSAALGKAMPGMLAGGPDGYRSDEYAKHELADMPPAKCYADHLNCYCSNEITIYWNSPLLYLLAEKICRK